ncbi:MAG: hypothetical protein HFI31_00470 [Lachnospiraceae bacterium]|nr:hypothetical protein [Lachnospiraceae bacterium]
MEITAEMAGLDAASKKVLRHKEVLAVIAKYVMEEYEGYSLEETMEFIEAESISSPEVSRGRTNTAIQGDFAEFEELHEKVSTFDVLDFLTALFYPHKADFRKTIEKYIDFTKSLELEREMQSTGGLGESVLEEGIEKGSFITLCSLAKDGLLKLEKAAKRANMSEAIFVERMRKLPP